MIHRMMTTASTLLILLALPAGTSALQSVGTDYPTLAERRAQLEEALDRRPGDYDTLVDYAAILHLQGIEGDDDAAEKALEILEELHGERPDHPVVRVYLGSALLLKAGRTWAVWKKGSLSKEGIRHMDAAVELAPLDPEIRFMRGASLRPLPGFFDMEEQAREDLTWVAERAERAVSNGTLTPGFGAAALFHRGEFLHEEGDLDGAREVWRRAAAMAPGSSASEDALRRLEETRPPGGRGRTG